MKRIGVKKNILFNIFSISFKGKIIEKKKKKKKKKENLLRHVTCFNAKCKCWIVKQTTNNFQ